MAKIGATRAVPTGPWRLFSILAPFVVLAGCAQTANLDSYDLGYAYYSSKLVVGADQLLESAPPPPPPPPAAPEYEDYVVEAVPPVPLGSGPRGPEPTESRARPRPAPQSFEIGDRSIDVVPPAGSAERRVYCDVTGKFMSSQICTEARTISANAKRGLGSVDYPRSITRGETRLVSFTVRRAARGEHLPPDNSVNTPDQPFALKVTGRMAALLQGEGFDIDPDKLQYRDIGISDAAEWNWRIRALKAPHHRLKLTAYMVVEAPDGSTSESAIVPSKEMAIPVKVTAVQWFGDLVESVVALSNSAKLMIGALAALLVVIIGFRDKLAQLLAPLLRKPAPQAN